MKRGFQGTDVVSCIQGMCINEGVFMNKETRNSLISGAIFLAFGIYLYFSGIGFEGRMRPPMNGDVGPAFMPKLIGIFIMLLSLGLLLSNLIPYLMKRKAGTAVSEPRQKATFSVKVVLTVVLMFLYMLLLSPVGFILSSIAYLFAQMAVIEGTLTRKKCLVFGSISVVSPVLIYLVFVHVFSLMLPAGILG
jgi:putative tricarboxylic transport membrane protein